MTNKINLILIIIITLFISYSCSCQDINLQFHKIEIDNNSNFYFRNGDEHIVQINKDSVQTIIYNSKMKNVPFYDFPSNLNFTVKDSLVLSLTIWKSCLSCSAKDFATNPWGIRVECRSTKNELTLAKSISYISSVTQLNIENIEPIISSKNQIHYDFIHFKENIWMLILVDNTLHLYENIGAVSNNQWKLIKSFRSNMQVPFQTYVDDTNKIILQFNPENIFHVDLQQTQLTRVRQKNKAKQCLVYDHQSKKYLWISQQEASTLLESDDPSSLIQGLLKNNRTND